MATSKSKAPPRFVLVDAAFANRTVERDEGGYWMKLRYDAEGRLVAAESSGPNEYSATLEIEPKVPRGSFCNSFRRPIDYGAWLTHMLLTM